MKVKLGLDMTIELNGFKVKKRGFLKGFSEIFLKLVMFVWTFMLDKRYFIVLFCYNYDIKNIYLMCFKRRLAPSKTNSEHTP